jgi:hypothetical protein
MSMEILVFLSKHIFDYIDLQMKKSTGLCSAHVWIKNLVLLDVAY